MTLEVKNPNNLPLLSTKGLIPTQGDLKDLTEANYEKLKKSFEKHGFIFPISVWQDGDKNYLIDGHQRQRVIVKEYGDAEVPIIKIPAKDIKEAAEILLKVTSQYGTITQEGLDTYIATYELPEAEIYQATHYDAISYLQTEEPEVEEDEAPGVSSEPPVSQLGVVYQLGRHRVMCGDSTDFGATTDLMNGVEANLYLTDPPYGVSYTDKNEFLNSIGGGDRLTNAIENDHQTPEEMFKFWMQVFTNACNVLKDTGSYYIFSPQGGDLLLLLQAVRDSGFQLKHVLIWAKNNHVLGRADYNYKHEPIVYGWKQGGTHTFYGKGDKLTSLWDYDKPLKNDLHPTMKPIEVLVNALRNSTQKDDVVFDHFLGSGSTLIACEQTDRTCYGMELDPKYVDVIRKRYAKFVSTDSQLPENWEEQTPAIERELSENEDA
jgi:DNA modification methylase